MRKRIFQLAILVIPLLIVAGLFWHSGGDEAQKLLNLRLIETVRRHDTAKVKKLLVQGADPNAWELEEPEFSLENLIRRFRYPPTPSVALAVAMGDGQLYHSKPPSEPVEMVELLLSHGAKARAICSNGDPLINTAAFEGYSHCVELFLAHGATVNEKHANGTTVLMSALAGGDLRTVQVLVDHGVEVNKAYVDLAKDYQNEKVIALLKRVCK
jgi:hypothetical protein